MPRLRSFAPVSRPDATVLILGSMPGAASLAAGEYYAHPRNTFWDLMGELAGAHRSVPYAQRLQRLLDARIALWDVMASCERHNSLDADIEEDSIVPNDFAAFFDAHPQIGCVLFNGAKAEQSFRRYVLPTLSRPLHLQRLPSTSPAHAGLRPADKLKAWRQALARSTSHRRS
jgi:hypoxanthine-DNA glycosylase